jgi:hypothetical protein
MPGSGLPSTATPVGQEHDFAGSLVASQIYQDSKAADPGNAFWVEVRAAGQTFDKQLTNGQMVTVPLTGVTLDGIVNPTLNFEIVDFNPGQGAPGQRRLTFNVRVRVRAIFWLQVGLITVTATY